MRSSFSLCHSGVLHIYFHEETCFCRFRSSDKDRLCKDTSSLTTCLYLMLQCIEATKVAESEDYQRKKNWRSNELNGIPFSGHNSVITALAYTSYLIITAKKLRRATRSNQRLDLTNLPDSSDKIVNTTRITKLRQNRLRSALKICEIHRE